MSAARSVTATFTAIPTFALNYTKAGTGDGTVSFSPGGSVASCAATCSTIVPANIRVRILARPAPGSMFTGWQGTCQGRRSCVVRMTEAQNVTASFDLLPTFALTYDAQGSGTGTVSFTQPTGIAPCTGDCTNSFPVLTRVTLTAQAGEGSTFTGWGGVCRDKRSCRVLMTDARTVTATFTASTPPTTIGALQP